MWHSLYCIFMVKRDKCNKVFRSLLQLIFYHPVTTATIYKYLTWIRVPGCVVLILFFFLFLLCKSKTSREQSEASVFHQLSCTSNRVSAALKAPQRHATNERFVKTTSCFFLKEKWFCPPAQSVLPSAFTAATMQWVSGGGDQGTKAVAN